MRKKIIATGMAAILGAGAIATGTAVATQHGMNKPACCKTSHCPDSCTCTKHKKCDACKKAHCKCTHGKGKKDSPCAGKKANMKKAPGKANPSAAAK